MIQLSSQHAYRPATQQSEPYRYTTASSTPRHAYPTTSSGNYPPFPAHIRRTHQPTAELRTAIKQIVVNYQRCELCLTRRPLLLADIVLSDSVIKSALIDTGATFSMIPMRTLYSINNPSPIETFITSPPRIVDVGGASATVRGYIDAP